MTIDKDDRVVGIGKQRLTIEYWQRAPNSVFCSIRNPQSPAQTRSTRVLSLNLCNQIIFVIVVDRRMCRAGAGCNPQSKQLVTPIGDKPIEGSSIFGTARR
jgi:hypothetical protein